MSAQFTPVPDQDTQNMLDCLRQTVTNTLERKRRLGHYAVLWQDNAPIAIGDDAPADLQPLTVQPTP
ncbi:MAG: hypothetical protein ABL925_09715 [Methylococcales bacterium]